MFVGHFGTAFAAKKITPQPSLGTLFLAAQFIDLLWPILLLLGLETVAVDPGNTAVTPLDFLHYPISHGMLAVLGWGVLFGLVYYFLKRNWKASLVLGLLVFGHWLLDLLTHRPDLPLWWMRSWKRPRTISRSSGRLMVSVKGSFLIIR